MNEYRKRHLLVPKPVSSNLSLILVFLALVYILNIFPPNSSNGIELSEKSSIFKNKKVFSHLDGDKEISYSVKSRESLDGSNIHIEYFQIEIPRGINKEKLLIVVQNIVKETISRENCHGIRIDFGPYGHVDFAPDGNWAEVEKAPLNHYKNYRFKYVFSSFLSSE